MKVRIKTGSEPLRKVLAAALASAGIGALWAPGFAYAQQAESKADQPAVDENAIVVFARREAENVQDVPVSIQVVTGETLQKQLITRAEDLSKFAAGLRLTSQNDSSGGLIILRGVRWAPGSGTEAIPIYLNDISFQPGDVLQSLFDIQQVEVLRGPQGTIRGAPSIAGAVTITTRKPELDQFGGYASASLATHNRWYVQGAVNAPIIKDKLAIRVAGLVDNSEANRVHSLAPGAKSPRLRTENVRASLLFQPTDTLSINASYQYMKNSGTIYSQVAGPGSPGVPARNIPANYNGPALQADDYKAVSDLGRDAKASRQLITVNASWDVLGQRLSYNYGYRHAGEGGAANVDVGNVVPGFDRRSSDGPQPPQGKSYYNVHELRLSSIRGGDRFFDYDLGYYRNRSEGTPTPTSLVYRPGSFGVPGTEVPGAVTTPVDRYAIPITTRIKLAIRNESYYGNLQIHLPADTEFSGGIRYIRDRRPANINITSGSFFSLFKNPTGGFIPCTSPLFGGAVTSPVYPGYCDFPVPAGVAFSDTENYNKQYSATIWNASLSHKFTPDILGYATVGTSWRQGLPAIANTGLPSSLLFPEPEKATSYEVGLKTTIAGKLRLNVDIFQINYKGQLTTGEGVNYYDAVNQNIGTTSLAFYTNVDAKVRGVEAEVNFQPTRAISLGVNLSYSKIKSEGGIVPCNDASRPITPANPINTCPSPKGKTLNVSSPFQASANGSYTVPLGPVEGYFRFNVDFQGRNPNISSSAPARGLAVTPTPAYAIVDLFAGLTGGDSAWDVGIYAKNVFNKKQELSSLPLNNGVFSDFGPTGYDVINTTVPREVGLSVRYSFGSR
ncbi:MAG TPA: TonB-dependent receptor [Sphingobium sp.]|uniref:TonB-dependent receptor n=1 Tax=Sphingobium sp. TaxID=1912891 RepID=UPI002ED2E4FB